VAQGLKVMTPTILKTLKDQIKRVQTTFVDDPNLPAEVVAANLEAERIERLVDDFSEKGRSELMATIACTTKFLLGWWDSGWVNPVDEIASGDDIGARFDEIREILDFRPDFQKMKDDKLWPSDRDFAQSLASAEKFRTELSEDEERRFINSSAQDVYENA